MRGVVVHHQVDFRLGALLDRLIDVLEEPQEFLMSMTLVATPDYFAGPGIQGGEQRCSAVSGVVVCVAFYLPRFHRQKRLGPVQRLHLALLVDAQDNRVLWWIHVKAHDIADFLDKQRIFRELEGLGAMWLKPEGTPDAANRRLAHARGFGHAACAPVGCVLWLCFQGHGDDVLHVVIGNVTIFTRGSVGMDQSLDLAAYVPILPQWVKDERLRNVIQGRSLEIPIAGTIRNPRIDTKRVEQSVRKLAGELLIGPSGGILDRELQRGLNQLFRQ